MGYARNAQIPWTCPGCGKSMVVSGTQLNSGKKRCSTTCPRTLERKVQSMEYDNVRDSQSHGSEWGVIVEGSVVQDEGTKEFVLLDEDGKAFSSQEFLKRYAGKTVRLTCIDLVSAQKMEDMIKELQAKGAG